MKVYRIKEALDSRLSNIALTMGNFDGVHKGHQRLLRLTIESARRRAGKAVVLTFDPHPVQVFKPSTFQLIQPLDERLERLERSGVDACVVMDFTRDLADYTPRGFLERCLLASFDIKHVVVGYDTTFGKGREGTPETIKAFGDEFGFKTTIVDPVMVGDSPVSSSRIRKTTIAGDITQTNDCLGYTFRVTGTVVKGYGRGASLLGYPTANLQTGRRLLPAKGVYAVWVQRRGERYRGALNIGTNPTFGNQELSVEVYILDFADNIYGESLTVQFVRRLRGEEKFDSLDALKQQMAEDVEEVRCELR